MDEVATSRSTIDLAVAPGSWSATPWTTTSAVFSVDNRPPGQQGLGREHMRFGGGSAVRNAQEASFGSVFR